MKYDANVFIIEDELAHRMAISKCLLDFTEKSEYINLCIDDTLNYIQLYRDVANFTICDNDVFLIDIHLNTDFTGIQLAKLLRGRNSNAFIIFLTSDDTLSQFSINQQIYPSGYLTKNISENIMTNDALFPILNEIQNTILNRLEKNVVIELKTSEGITLVNPFDISYITTVSGLQKKTVVKTKDIEFIANERLVDIRKKLNSPAFFNSLKSYIINLLMISSLNQSQGMIYFKDKRELFIGSRHIAKLKKRYKNLEV
ncbi:LytR/AlgR family response regulator transcription factor [Enterococcus sp. LJL120]